MSEQHAAQDRIDKYSRRYAELAASDFESTLVHYRQRTILEHLDEKPLANIVEVGCGLDLLCLVAQKQDIRFSKWIIVEPSSQFADAARLKTAGLETVEIIQQFFENATGTLALAGTVDLVIVSSLLHEVDDPGLILKQASTILRRGGRVFVIVPNAGSLHRRLAVAMGLISEPGTLSERNHHLMQKRVFDRATLEELCVAHGFSVIRSSGIFLKPFTNEQMTFCAAHLPADVMSGLWRLGEALPELAAEIFFEVEKLTDKQSSGPTTLDRRL